MTDPSAPTSGVTGLSRRVAQRQLAAVERYDEAVQRYAQDLRQYAAGEIDGTEFGRDVVSLSVTQTARNVGEAVKLSAELSRWALSLVGAQVREEPEESESPGTKGTAQKSTGKKSTAKKSTGEKSTGEKRTGSQSG